MTASRRTRILMVTAGLLAVMGPLTSCSSSDSGSAKATGTYEKPPVTPANADGCRDAGKAAAVNSAPSVNVPDDLAKAPFATDDIPGCGPLVKSGDTVWVGYVLKSGASGKVVDDSWKAGTPLNFVLGQGQVIKGWDKGIPGMRVGGRRTLVIPAKYGYGAAGNPPAIAKNDTLIFVIDALATVPAKK